MAAPLSADRVLSALKAEGVSVQEYQSWRTHNRNHVGIWGPVHGVVIHHTVTSADDSSVALCYNGHSSLPGPLCHGVGRNDGKIALVGHGRANHAGSGDNDVLQAVIAETALPADNEANTDGNRYFYGLEIVNLGNGADTYPWVQYVAAVKWAVAHLRAHGWNERSVIGHKEWQPGKIDPYGPVVGPDGKQFDFTMDRFRADVKAALALPAGQWPGAAPTPPKEEESVALTTDDVSKVFKTDGLIKSPDYKLATETNKFWTAESYFYETYRQARANGSTVSLIKDELRALSAKVDELQTGSVDLDALADKVADKLSTRLAS